MVAFAALLAFGCGARLGARGRAATAADSRTRWGGWPSGAGAPSVRGLPTNAGGKSAVLGSLTLPGTRLSECIIPGARHGGRIVY
jgi:hypothetical protein